MRLRCPDCGSKTYVVATRYQGEVVKRYRKCKKCNKNLVSVESWVDKQTQGPQREEPWYMDGAF